MFARGRLIPVIIYLTAGATLFAQTNAASPARTLVVIAAGPVFIAPDETRGPLRVLPVGTELRVRSVEGSWYLVQFKDPDYDVRVGYIHARYVQALTTKNAEGDSPTSDRPAGSGVAPPASAPATPDLLFPPAGTSTTPTASPATSVTATKAATAATPPVAHRSAAMAMPAKSSQPSRANGPSGLDQRDMIEAVQIGFRAHGRFTGLLLTDTGRAWGNALTAMNNSMNHRADATAGVGFSLHVYTPKTWIAQLSSNAAKEYRPYDLSNITEADLEPVLRVEVYPDMPTVLNGEGMRLSQSVQHVVLRDDKRRLVVQPVSVDGFTQTASSAMRDKVYEGLVATFRLDAVEQLRGESQDHEFLIVVIGHGSEKTFKIKTKHFEHLPYRLR